MMTPSQAFQKNPVMVIANILVILGALNWLGVALSNTNYAAHLTGSYTKYLLIVIGLAGVYLAYHKVMWFMQSYNAPMSTQVVVEHMQSCSMKNGKLVCNSK